MTAQRTGSVEIPLVDVTATVLWSLALTIGLIGFVIPYARPFPPQKKEIAINAETLEVQLTRDLIPARVTQPQASVPPAPAALPVSDAPALTPVAELSAVAFALPVEAPSQVVPVAAAAISAPAVHTNAAAVPQASPVPRQLVFGHGEARQPAPEYPYRARREGQEGSVKVRFSVAETGQVLAAEVVGPSPWPLLNEAALRVIRERWRFAGGALRLFEVSIRFQLDR
jgi:TonB family protein